MRYIVVPSLSHLYIFSEIVKERVLKAPVLHETDTDIRISCGTPESLRTTVVEAVLVKRVVVHPESPWPYPYSPKLVFISSGGHVPETHAVSSI